jgi:hypothetical protein
VVCFRVAGTPFIITTIAAFDCCMDGGMCSDEAWFFIQEKLSLTFRVLQFFRDVVVPDPPSAEIVLDF